MSPILRVFSFLGDIIRIHFVWLTVQSLVFLAAIAQDRGLLLSSCDISVLVRLLLSRQLFCYPPSTPCNIVAHVSFVLSCFSRSVQFQGLPRLVHDCCDRVDGAIAIEDGFMECQERFVGSDAGITGLILNYISRLTVGTDRSRILQLSSSKCQCPIFYHQSHHVSFTDS